MFGLTRVRLDLVRWILIRRRAVGRGSSGVGSRLGWRDGSAADRPMARRAERRLGSTLGGAGDDVRRRAAAGVAGVAKIGTPGTVRGRGNSGEVACVMRRPMETSTSVRRAGKVVRHGVPRSGNSGEQTPVGQSEGERAKGLARILTTDLSSCGCWTSKRGGGAASWRRHRAQRLQWRGRGTG